MRSRPDFFRSGYELAASKLDRITLISNSDAHSPAKIGREANVLDCAMNYKEVMDVIRTGDPNRFLYTIEFYPEEGKYHYDGHRVCNVVFDPKTSRNTGLFARNAARS